MNPGPTEHRGRGHLAVLDGWRAVSILLVMATHMLPLGPRSWNLNSTAGPAGMSIFFTLSGLLITSTLLRDDNVPAFLVRRLFRILPLAWLGGTVILALQAAPLRAYPPLWFYYSNYMPAIPGVEKVSHFWSLCVEIHFYVGVALLVGILGRRGLWLLPVFSLVITSLRVRDGAVISINTHHRVDEILAGAILALSVLPRAGGDAGPVARALSKVPVLAVAVPFVASCHPSSGALQYLRPYLGAALVGATMVRPRPWLGFLQSGVMRYVAEVSYALYVIHPATMLGWLGTGDVVGRYTKRMFSLAAAFGLAHLSTYMFERPMTELGRRIAARLGNRGDRLHRGSVTANDGPLPPLPPPPSQPR